MKTLYVTDLDGTLLNSEKQLTDYSASVINRFIAQGGLFSVATARMAYGCDEKLAAINLNVPGIIMNGACLYSFAGKKYLDTCTINPANIQLVEDVFDRNGCNAFFYAYNDNAMSIFYKMDPQPEDVQYLSKRAKEYCREISQVKSYAAAAQGRDIVYIASTGSREKIEAVGNDIQSIPGIASTMYLNIYNGLYCLEIFDVQANKANALLRLKRLLGVDKVIAFGDNHNDTEMMRIADQCYAPDNAVDEVKAMADEILESCDNDGVARFLQQKYDL